MPMTIILLDRLNRQNKYPHKLIMIKIIYMTIIKEEQSYKITPINKKAQQHQKQSQLTLPKMALLSDKAQYKKITSEATVITWTQLWWKEILILMGLPTKLIIIETKMIE